MIIYGAILIPIIVAILLWLFFKHETVWWEFCIPFASSIVFIVGMKATIEYIQIQSEEYWGSFVERVEYYEDWNEYIHRTCTRSCGKNCTTVYDCSYVQYHPAYWQIVTTTGETVKISQSEYSRIRKLFDNELFQELNRNSYTNDGDEYYSVWGSKRDSLKAIPVTTLHHYENRVKASDGSVFHFEPVDTATIRHYALKEYPEITEEYKQDALIGYNGKDFKACNAKLKYINAELGHRKEVRLYVLIFENQPIEAGLYQESYWSGGNMNEFVVCIGTDKDQSVKWCRPISWTPQEALKARVRQYVMSQEKLNLSGIADYLRSDLNKTFIRRNFKEFDYLTVEPPTWSVWLTYILTIMLNLGISSWIIRNEYNEH